MATKAMSTGRAGVAGVTSVSISDRARNLLPRRQGMRFLGIGLIAYGVIGIVIIGLALLLSGPAIARADRLAGSAIRTLNAGTEAADAAADAFVGFDTSLIQAQASTGDAADLSREASATLDRMAAAMSLSIFGRPAAAPARRRHAGPAPTSSADSGRISTRSERRSAPIGAMSIASAGERGSWPTSWNG